MTKDVAADLIAAIEKQRAKGLREYGKGVDPLDNYDWIDEGGSELIDCWVYLLAHKNLVRHLKDRVAELEKATTTGKFLIPEGRRYTDPRSIWERLPRIANFDFDAGMVYPEEAAMLLEMRSRVTELEETQKQLQEKLHSAVARIAELEGETAVKFDCGRE